MSHLPSYLRRPTYTTEQLLAYYDRISLPRRYRYNDSEEAATVLTCTTEALDLLKAIQKWQLAKVPFENLSLHYSMKPHVSIDPHDIFEKIVTRKEGRGGYCMENTCLLETVLRSLGFNVYPCGARVNEAVQPVAASEDWEGPRFDGWNHMVLIVTIDETQYLVDVGFSNMSPCQPLALQEGIVGANAGLQQVRLIRTGPTEYVSQHTAHNVWEYQIRFTQAAAWTPAYSLSLTEFLPRDFQCMNYYTSTNGGSWFTRDIVCVRMLLDEVAERFIGDVTLFNGECKRRTDGQSDLVRLCTTEDDRLDVLERHFDIHLNVKEREAIRGRQSELVSK